jgi:hypothetical protein
MAAAVTSSPKISPQVLKGLLEVTISEARLACSPVGR